MIVNLPPACGDDAGYIASLCGLLAALVEQHRPATVHLIRVDNWFDHKWLRFSGMGRVAFDRGFPRIDTALDPMWQQGTTFPPFSPGRILGEQSFQRESEGRYARAELAPIHPASREHSAGNLQRRIESEFSSALFAWFSSNSASTGQASLLVYEVDDSVLTSWYSSFHVARGAWHVRLTKGIDRRRLTNLFSPTESAGV